MAKEFVFDHSYWSVNVSDEHYADQEVVSHMTNMSLYRSGISTVMHADTCTCMYIMTFSGRQKYRSVVIPCVESLALPYNASLSKNLLT